MFAIYANNNSYVLACFFTFVQVSFQVGGIHTRISSNIYGVAGVTGDRVCIRTGCIALLPINHQLQLVPFLGGGDGVPLSITEAFSLRNVHCRKAPSSIVNMEEQLRGRERHMETTNKLTACSQTNFIILRDSLKLVCEKFSQKILSKNYFL